jgi:bifunctional N-acetylglutamate synthase/kinase
MGTKRVRSTLETGARATLGSDRFLLDARVRDSLRQVSRPVPRVKPRWGQSGPLAWCLWLPIMGRCVAPLWPRPADPMNDVRTTISRLLSNMGSSREIQLYLKRFSQLEAARFAVVRVDGMALRDDLPPLVSSLGFLQQVGLTPIVVHGARPQIAAAMAERGISRLEVDGVPCTSREELGLARSILQLENLRLVEALQGQGARATSIPSGVFQAEWRDRKKFGFLGDVVEVRTAPVEAATAAGSIPVIAALGETEDGQLLTVRNEDAVSQLARRLEPYKIIFLSPAGGLLDEHGRLMESINLTTEYASLVGREGLAMETRAELERIHDLLMELPSASSVSITRPDEMAKELFTHRGSGTLVRRGEEVLRFGSWEGVDRERLRSLIESSFGRGLRADYFDLVQPRQVYVSENYRAAIVLTQVGESTYMDKFAVSEQAQGEGLGSAIWKVMRAEHRQLFWRSQRGNPVNEFYFAQADGAAKDARWTVFWYGLPDWEAVRAAVDAAREHPVSLEAWRGDGDRTG